MGLLLIKPAELLLFLTGADNHQSAPAGGYEFCDGLGPTASLKGIPFCLAGIAGDFR
jgi:hypothetical protein